METALVDPRNMDLKDRAIYRHSSKTTAHNAIHLATSTYLQTSQLCFNNATYNPTRTLATTLNQHPVTLQHPDHRFTWTQTSQPDRCSIDQAPAIHTHRLLTTPTHWSTPISRINSTLDLTKLKLALSSWTRLASQSHKTKQ